ncbi:MULTISPECIES: hypothetical protein [Acinetobacter]|uniref:Uncharacterized protein n=1 Tax=Acinetobacter indicus TaxID=756892 RepID=A0A6C0Y6H5_9GAMM|nr:MULTISPECIES: hypothetical protein [Acinetobacter]QIC71841.1 hypothetical protein FSC09_15740 [Acinetobacter indicus]QKQ71377.1 hypothetical protein E5Y90_14190 [Acinetobacter sp. 10FS3-1]
MIASVFKKVGKGKVLAIVEQAQGSVCVEDLISPTSENLVAVIENIKSNAYEVAPATINLALHGHLPHKPISVNSSELKIITGARFHNDYALECTITDLNALAETDIRAAGDVAQQITEIFISKSGTIREPALINSLAAGTMRKFKDFLTMHHTKFQTLTGMDKVNSVADLLNELRRIQGRLVDPAVIAHFCRILNEEILPLDILGPTLRFSITDSLCRFYLSEVDENQLIIGIDNNNGVSLCANSDATHFVILANDIDNNTNKSVIKRMYETKCEELSNLFTYGPTNVLVYDASKLKGSIKSLNRYNSEDVAELVREHELEVVDTIIGYGFSNAENLENITLRAFVKKYQNDLRFNA